MRPSHGWQYPTFGGSPHGTLREYRTAMACRARRAHVLLLRDEGWTVREVRQITFTSFDLINDCVQRFRSGGAVESLGDNEVTRSLPKWLHRVRRWLRGVRKIHVICDNAPFHKSRLVRAYLNSWGHWINLHYLPKYAPETNTIESDWWQLHETLTRNFRCATLEELLEDVYTWLHSSDAAYHANDSSPNANAA